MYVANIVWHVSERLSPRVIVYSLFPVLTEPISSLVMPKSLRNRSVLFLLPLFILLCVIVFALYGNLSNQFLLISSAPCIFYLFFHYHKRRLETVVIETSEKVRTLQRVADERLKTIEALASAIDAKDQTPQGHVRRTRTYAVEVGKLLGLSEDEISALSAGALLHDVGKLAVPEYILNKPDKLTAAEFERMKIHTTVGAAILGGVDFSYPVADAVLYHHEKWDGGGYPKGLKGEQIPLVARILAVVDFYDTTRCDRPYRPGMRREDSLALLRRKAGTSFDPRVVETFIRNVDSLDKLIASEDLLEQAPEDRGITVEGAKADTFTADDEQANAGTATGLRSILEAQKEVFTLHEIAHTVGRSLSLEDTFELVSCKLDSIIAFDTCVIHVLDEKSGDAYAAHVAGAHEDYFASRRTSIGDGITGWVLANARPMLSNTPRLDLPDAPEEIADHIRGVISAPLIREGVSFGAISLYSSSEPAFAAEHLRLLESVTLYASNAVNNALTFEKTRASALSDPLTGLPNSRAIHLLLEQRLAECRRQEGASLLVMSMDLDGFRGVNEVHGHGVGDRLITEVSGVLKAQLRQMDMLARYSGDEFVAVIPSANADSSSVVTERIRSAVESYQFTIRTGQTERFSVSIGVACSPTDGETADQILLAAHRDMKRNKAARKFSSDTARGADVIPLDAYR